MFDETRQNARMPVREQPEDWGTTGLQEWVNRAPDLFEFKQRRDRAEDIIRNRCGSFAAMIFVEKLCDDRPAARRQIASEQDHWQRTKAHALEWARIIKDALIAGQPVPIKPTWQYQHVLNLAYDVATGQCPFLSL